MTQNPSKETEQSANHTRIWAIVGQVAVILGIIVAGITIWSYFFPSRPDLYARVQDSTRLLPVNLLRDLQTTITKHFLFSYIHSIDGSQPNFFETHDKVFLKQLDSYSDKTIEDNKKSLFEIQRVRQKLRVSIYNIGQKEAQSVNVELPRTVTGFYQLDFSSEDPRPFERIIQINNIRPDSFAYVDIWLNDVVIDGDDIKVNYPDGIVPVKKPFDRNEDWTNALSFPILIFENLVIITLIVISLSRVAKAKESVEEKDTKIQ